VRPGFTLLELVVCIAVLAVLAAVILPSLQTSRGGRRRIECLNNMRNLGIAAQSYATTRNGSLPYLIDRSEHINWGTTDSPLNSASPWTVQILPFIEAGPLYERLVTSSNSEETPADFRIDTLAAVKLKVFNCGDDPDDDAAGNLSYAINTGYIGDQVFGSDVTFLFDPTAAPGQPPVRGHSTASYAFRSNAGNAEPDAEIARSTGVAWPDRQVKMNEISQGDGTTSTLLLAENYQAQRWAGRAPAIETRGTPTIEYEISDISFGIPMSVTGKALPYLVADNASRPADGVGAPNASKPLALHANFTGACADTPRDSRINKNVKTAKEGETPRPSSFHSGGVNVIFVAGNGKFLAETIDPALYAQLLTWDGARQGQQKISDTAF
jgi:prepilin-type N-terminal cleavage/methylation domain-containing protein